MAARVEFYRSTDGRTRLFGRHWEEVPRGRLAVLLCRTGQHRRVMWGWINGIGQDRCSCGARRYVSGRWAGGDPGRRHPHRSLEDEISQELARLLACQPRFLMLLDKQAS